MDRSWIKCRLFSKPYLDGVNDFMKFISERFGENEEILCPCRRCLNRIYAYKGVVEDHLYIHGITSTYDRWIYHGEPSDVGIHENAEHLDEHIELNEDVHVNEDEEDPDDRIPDMIQELYTAEDQNAQSGEKSLFAAILEQMKQELYPGCASFSKFSFVVKLLHIKSFYRISNVAFTAILKLLSAAFPNCSLPASYHEAKKYIHALGLGYDSIHVCPNNCVLFWKEYEKNDECPICNESRWKDKDGRKQIPQKVLRHFPLIPRLKRMFASKKSAEEARWHKLKRQPVENELSHPADGEAWKDFDSKYGWFAQDGRNIRLGLATDGFNPFGNMSSSYSMWPVFVIPYNFAPCDCMEQSNFMMTLLIPGPKCPGKDIDVFLEPLIEELLELWTGVRTFDAFTGTMFDLHAAVLWCIHDYPALSTLSGRVTRGYYACVRCDKDPCSVSIKRKIVYIDFRRFLPKDHDAMVAATEDAMVAADCSIQHGDQIQNTNEGQPSDMISQFNRGRSMGKDLERITRGLSSKIPVLVAEGKRRPEAPMQAAKLASEGGIIFRQHMPILPHWKEYKKDKTLLPNYISRIGGHFMMDTNNKAVAEACYDILKCVQRQTRYHLKKHYFDGVPANRVSTKSPLKHVTDEQWKALVAMWSDPKHKDRCTKNKENREKVQFHQRTGSRSYIAHCHAVKQEKYNGVDPNAIDLFKDCHFSNKVGYSEPVKKAIADMEAKLAEPTLEGQEPKSPTKVVSEVLPKTKFLQNIGLESAAPKRSAKAAVAARVQDLEAELESEKQGAAELRDKIDTQQHELDTLKKKVEEFDNLKKTSDETNALLRRLLSINKV